MTIHLLLIVVTMLFNQHLNGIEDFTKSPLHSDNFQLAALSEDFEIQVLKAKTYIAMTRLDGWCSREKASILIDIILDIKPEVIVEIGVFGGKSLIPMAFALSYNGKGKIYGVDPWSASESATGMDGVNYEWWSSIDHDAILKKLEMRIIEFNLANYIELIRATSESCRPIENIEILHIDGNHSEKTSLYDVLKWVPYVKKGGLIIFDDIDWVTTRDATGWLNSNCKKLIEYKADNVWGIWVKP